MSLLKTWQWLPAALVKTRGYFQWYHSLHWCTGPWFSAYFSGLLYHHSPMITLTSSFIEIVLVLLGECDFFSEC